MDIMQLMKDAQLSKGYYTERNGRLFYLSPVAKGTKICNIIIIIIVQGTVGENTNGNKINKQSFWFPQLNKKYLMLHFVYQLITSIVFSFQSWVGSSSKFYELFHLKRLLHVKTTLIKAVRLKPNCKQRAEKY